MNSFEYNTFTRNLKRIFRVALGQRSQILQGTSDLVGNWWGSGQMIALRLETVLIGNVAQLDWDSLGRDVTELTLGDLVIKFAIQSNVSITVTK